LSHYLGDNKDRYIGCLFHDDLQFEMIGFSANTYDDKSLTYVSDHCSFILQIF